MSERKREIDRDMQRQRYRGCLDKKNSKKKKNGVR